MVIFAQVPQSFRKIILRSSDNQSRCWRCCGANSGFGCSITTSYIKSIFKEQKTPTNVRDWPSPPLRRKHHSTRYCCKRGAYPNAADRQQQVHPVGRTLRHRHPEGPPQLSFNEVRFREVEKQ